MQPPPLSAIPPLVPVESESIGIDTGSGSGAGLEATKRENISMDVSRSGLWVARLVICLGAC